MAVKKYSHDQPAMLGGQRLWLTAMMVRGASQRLGRSSTCLSVKLHGQNVGSSDRLLRQGAGTTLGYGCCLMTWKIVLRSACLGAAMGSALVNRVAHRPMAVSGAGTTICSVVDMQPHDQ